MEMHNQIDSSILFLLGFIAFGAATYATLKHKKECEKPVYQHVRVD